MIDLDSSSALDELELGAYAAARVSHALQNSQHPLVMTIRENTRELSLKGTSPLVCRARFYLRLNSDLTETWPRLSCV